ncbi:MAG: class I SAM-dependent methyltransferase [Acidimicrobiia bacterium]
MNPYTADNVANWNERAPIHAASDLYDLNGLVADNRQLSSIVEFDRDYLGDLTGKTLLHPQCHIGTDTLSLARLGAQVTGLDFSSASLEVARELAMRMGINARFVESEIYEAPSVLAETFDIVYTGVGAIGWLPDIVRWAEVMATFCKPGGMFYIREGHPMLWALDDEREDGQLVVTEPYFETLTPGTWDQPTTYTGPEHLEHSVSHSWNHGIGEIITALMGAGFRIDLFEEHKFVDWKALPHMIESRSHRAAWELPPEQKDKVPLMYSVLATRVPAGS